jgi:tRNA1Val (adenine37-N6)-methyltransferase
MKVGIDGVLLGIWADTENTNSILDIGTGTALIALMLAQRSSAFIDAIDIDKDAIVQATENIENSKWANRIKPHRASLQQFSSSTQNRYDLIVSNPPYFINSLKAPAQNRSTARHTDSLSHEELIINSKMLLTESGRLCIILPVNEALQCIDFAHSQGLYCSKKLMVHPKPDSEAKRLLVEFQKSKIETTISSLTIEIDRHQYSAEFSSLAKDFYLKL